MDRDHKRISRRQALAGAGAVSLSALLAACGEDDGEATGTNVATTEGETTVQSRSGSSSLADLFDESSACTLTAEQTEGPYYFDADKIRSDIREDRDGVDLRLAIRVREAGACEPLRNAVVDLWHADAGGIYSGFDSGAGEVFLRGAQVTDRDGIVEFTTVYPGWYVGRTPHIHAVVHMDNATALTTQLYFDDAISTSVYEAGSPYKPDEGRQTNDSDGIFDESLVLDLSEEGEGYLGTISLDAASA
jgi:protocatechuate 3,4-dioxygenase beta subunit